MEDKIDIKFYRRTIAELKDRTSLGFQDPNRILGVMTESTCRALLNNPSLVDKDDVCQIIALDGDKVIGSEISFANRYLVDGEVKFCRGASTLYVDEKYRKYAVGADIMINAATIIPKQDNIVAGISQMAFPLYKAMRYVCFPFDRFIFLNKTRVALETVFKTSNCITRYLSAAIDVVWKFLIFIVFLGNRWRMRNYKIERVKEIPEEVERIVLDDEHKYKELHDKKWFEWNLNYSFSDSPLNNKYLCVVKDKSNKIVGFFLNKVEFYPVASSRKFKNVLLGTVSEWGLDKHVKISEYDIQVLALRNMPNRVDGIQIATSNNKVAKVLKKHLFFPMGKANFAAYIQSFKDKSLKDIDNWRVRIASGDTLLN